MPLSEQIGTTRGLRISSIDIGSNAIRQVIVEIQPDGQWRILKKFRAPLRLGTDVFEGRQIKPHTLTELIFTFRKMARLNRKYKVHKVLALATSAMRDAKNKMQVLTAIRKASKIKVEIITGQREAHLIQQSIFKSQIVNFKSALLIDIGGGSAELTALEKNKIIFSKSYPLGVVRLLAQTQKNKSNVTAMAKKYLQTLRKQAHHNKYEIAIGTGGNFDALSKLKIELLKKTPHTNVTYAEVQQLFRLWNKMTLKQKQSLDIRRDRIDVLGLALELILAIMSEFKIKKLKIPLTGLKEGAIHSLL